MLRITITKIKKAWSLALSARGRGGTRTFPGKFHRLLVVTSAQKSTTSGKDADPRCKKCEQIIKYIFDSNSSINDYRKIQEIIRNSKKSKGSRIASIQRQRSAIINRESKIGDKLKRQSTTIISVQKSQGIVNDSQKSPSSILDTQKLGKLLGNIYRQKDASHSEDVTKPNAPINNTNTLQSTTAKQTEEQLAQKIEIIEEVPLVEAERQKIEGFNTPPKILGQSNTENIVYNKTPKSKLVRETIVRENVKYKIENLVRRLESALLTENMTNRKHGVVNFATNDSGQEGKSGGTSDVDKEGSEEKQDPGYPCQIDERLIKGMKQLGVPGSGGGSTINIHTDTSKKSQAPMKETNLEARKSENDPPNKQKVDSVEKEHLTFPPLSNNSYESQNDNSSLRDESVRYSNIDQSQANETNKGGNVTNEQGYSGQIPEGQQQTYNEQQQQIYNQQFMDNREQPEDGKEQETSGIARYSDQTTLNKEGDESNESGRADTEQKSDEQQQIHNEQSKENREQYTSRIVRYSDQTILNKEGDEENKDEKADAEEKSEEQQQIYNQQQVFNQQFVDNKQQGAEIVRYSDETALAKADEETNKADSVDAEQKPEAQISEEQKLVPDRGIVRYSDSNPLTIKDRDDNKASHPDVEQNSEGQQQIYNQQQMYNEQSRDNNEQDTSGIVHYTDQTIISKEGDEANKDEKAGAEQISGTEEKSEQQQIYNQQQQMFNHQFAGNREQATEIVRNFDQTAMAKADEEVDKAENINAEQKPGPQTSEEQILVPDRAIIRYSELNPLTKDDQDINKSEAGPERLANTKIEQPSDNKEQNTPERTPVFPNIPGQYPKLTPYGMFYPNFQSYPNANFYNGQGFAYPRHLGLNEHLYGNPYAQTPKTEQRTKQENKNSESAEQEDLQKSRDVQTSSEDTSLILDQKTPLLAMQLKPDLSENSSNYIVRKSEQTVSKPNTQLTKLIAVKPAFDEEKASESGYAQKLKENDLDKQVVTPNAATYEYPQQTTPTFSLYGNYSDRENAFPDQKTPKSQPQAEKPKQYYHMQKLKSKSEEKGKESANVSLDDKTVLNVDPNTPLIDNELKSLQHSELQLEMNMASLNKKLKSSDMEVSSPETLNEEVSRSEAQTSSKHQEMKPENETVMTVSAPVKDAEPCVELYSEPVSQPPKQSQTVVIPSIETESSHGISEKLQNTASESALSAQKMTLKYDKIKQENIQKASDPLKEGEATKLGATSMAALPLPQKITPKDHQTIQQPESITPEEITTEYDETKKEQASVGPSPEKKGPMNGKIPLSEMLRRVRMRSRIEQIEELEKLLESTEGKCGTPKPPCPPPTPQCPCAPPPPPPPCPPPPPRCPRPCKSSPCPPPCSPTNEPKKPCCKMVSITDTLKNIFSQLWDFGSTRFPYQTPTTHPYQIETKNSFTKAVLTEEMILQLQDWGSRMLTTYLRLGQCYWRMETIALARTFEPWVPIPSWPIPKKKEKKKLVCPKDGCKQRPPPRYGDPCEEACYPGNPCLDATPRREKKSRAPPVAAVQDPYDKIAERCNKIPDDQIDERLLAEMEKLGILKTTSCIIGGDKRRYRHAMPRKRNRYVQARVLTQLERLHSNAHKKYRATKEPRIVKYIPNDHVKMYKTELKQLYGIEEKSATNLEKSKPVELLEETEIESEEKKPIFNDKMPLIDPYDKRSLKHFADEDFVDLIVHSDSNFIYDHNNSSHIASKLCVNSAKEEKAINETIYSAMRQFQKIFVSNQITLKHNPKSQKTRFDNSRKIHKINVANAQKTTQSFTIKETLCVSKKAITNYSLAEKIPTTKELRDIKQPLVVQSSILPSFEDIEDNENLLQSPSIRTLPVDNSTVSEHKQQLERFKHENLIQLTQAHRINISYPLPRPNKQNEENKTLKPIKKEINDQKPEGKIIEPLSSTSRWNKKHIITILPSNIHAAFLQKEFKFRTKFGDERTHRLLAQAAIFSSEPPKSPPATEINKKTTPNFSNRKRKASGEKVTFDQGLVEQHKAPDLTEFRVKPTQQSCSPPTLPVSWNPEKYRWDDRQFDAEAKARLAQELVSALKLRFTLVVKPQNTRRNLHALKIKSQRANYERSLKAMKPSIHVSVENASQPLESLKLVADYNRQLEELKLKNNMTSQKLQSEAILETKSNRAFIVPLAVQARNKVNIAKLVNPNDQNRLKKNAHTEQAENKTAEVVVKPDLTTILNASRIQKNNNQQHIRPSLLYQMNKASNWKEKINVDFNIQKTEDDKLVRNNTKQDLAKPSLIEENDDATFKPVLSTQEKKSDISDNTSTSKLPVIQSTHILEARASTAAKTKRVNSLKNISSTVRIKEQKKFINQDESTKMRNQSSVTQKLKTSNQLEKPLQETRSKLSAKLQQGTENLSKNELNFKYQSKEPYISDIRKQNVEQKQTELYSKDIADRIQEPLANEYALERARHLAESTKFFGEALKKASIKPPATDLTLETEPIEEIYPNSDNKKKRNIVRSTIEQDKTDRNIDAETEIVEKNQTEEQGFIKQIQNALYSFTGSKTATKENVATEETIKGPVEKNEETAKTTQNNQDIKSILVILPKLKPGEQETPLSESSQKVRDHNSKKISEEPEKDCLTKASDDKKIIPKCPKGPCGPKPPPPCPCGPTKPECPIICPRAVPPCHPPRCPHKPIPRPIRKMPKCPSISPTTPRPTGPCTPRPCSPSKPLVKGPPCPCPPYKPPCKPCPPPCPPPKCPPPCPIPCTPKPPCPPLKCPCDPPPCPPCKCPPPCPDSPCPSSPHPTCPPPAPPPCPPKPPCTPPKCPLPCPPPCPEPPPCPPPKCPSQKNPPPCPPPLPPPCPKPDTTPCKPLKWPCKPPKKPCS